MKITPKMIDDELYELEKVLMEKRELPLLLLTMNGIDDTIGIVTPNDLSIDMQIIMFEGCIKHLTERRNQIKYN